MINLRNFLSIIAVAMLATSILNAQSGGDARTSNFEKDDLAFDFPVDWKLTDWSADGAQRITIATPDGAAEIAIFDSVGGDDLCDFQTAAKRTTENLLGTIAPKIRAASPLLTTPVKTHIGAQEVEGIQIPGLWSNRAATCEIYSFRLNFHLVSLVYLHIEDDTRAPLAWDFLRTSLKLATPVIGAAVAHAGIPGSPNVLNGRALHLVQPPYPITARQAHASGKVIVQVIINEEGNVISARAISGHPLLQQVSVAAAAASKFSPTKLCEEPVRVSGVIQYRFVAM